MKIDADSIIVAAPGQYSARLGNEAVVAGIGRGEYYALNPVAAHVWQLIQTPIRAGDLRQTVAYEYDVTLERLEADLFALLEDLYQEGLIEVTNEH